MAMRAATLCIALLSCWPLSESCAEALRNPLWPPTAIKTDRLEPPPVIVTRQAWGAKQPLSGMKPQHAAGIILHNTGVQKNHSISLDHKMRGLQAFSQKTGEVSPGHMKPSWPDIPYHYYIDADGRIAEGRDPNFAGDTNTNYDTSGYIQIVVEGEFEKEIPSTEQISALRDLLTWLLRSKGLAVENITVHKDHAPTDCPGKNLMAVLPSVLAQVKERVASASNH